MRTRFLLALLPLLWGCDRSSTGDPEPLPGSTALPSTGTSTVSLPDSVRTGFCDVAVLAQAFADRTSGLAVSQSGTVTRVLADDTVGDRHQRFVLRLANGQTVLIAHNLDLAPRLPGVAAGKTVAFQGSYEWNAEGGVVHWTHHDPAGVHAAGWLWMDGIRVR